MKKQEMFGIRKNYNSKLKWYVVLIAGFWTVAIIASLVWNFIQVNKTATELAFNEARVAHSKDVFYRRWNASHGGVYVPVTKQTPPNPYLKHPERDIITPSGKLLTLMNPAYMTRQVHKLAKERTGWQAHITSLRPVRPENAPDAWEMEALKAFERAEPEKSSIGVLEGKEYFRFMKPLITEKKCLKCHSVHGYKEGDIRGGISVSIPMEPFRVIAYRHKVILVAAHTLLWLLGMVGIGYGTKRIKKDITERKLAESKIMQAKEEWERTFDAVPDAIMLLKKEHEIIRVNKSMAALLGLTPDECVGQVCHKLVHGTNEAPSFCPHVRLLKDGQEQTEEVREERLGGDFLVSVSPLFDAKGKLAGSVHVARDITDRKRAEEALQKAHDKLEQRVEERTADLKQTYEQLLHAEKLGAIGKLSASIAHEFNNPLYGIRSVLDGIKETVPLDETNMKLVNLALKESYRVTDFIKSLQDFNRPTSGVVAPMDIHQALDDIILLCNKEFKTKNIKITKNYATDMPKIKGVEDQIKQVVLNVLNNAGEAIIKEGGTINISTEVIKENIAIKVHDTGVGIKPEDMDKIFEPFFTTKTSVKGTGLGLSVSYGIIKKHGGDIEVKTDPDKGTTFTILLPKKV
jgi:PAS domain S-box-containing protein